MEAAVEGKPYANGSLSPVSWLLLCSTESITELDHNLSGLFRNYLFVCWDFSSTRLDWIPIDWHQWRDRDVAQVQGRRLLMQIDNESLVLFYYHRCP